MADLLTLSQYKVYEGITQNTEDTKLEALIDVVSQTIRTYCGRSFTSYHSTGFTEYFSFFSSIRAVFPTEYPLVQVVSIRERLSPLSDYTDLVEDEDFVVDPTSDGIYRVNKDFPLGVKALEVTYKGGYESVPEDLKLAVVHMINYYKNREWIQDKTAPGGFSLKGAAFEEVHKTDSDFPDHIRRVLNFYKY